MGYGLQGSLKDQFLLGRLPNRSFIETTVGINSILDVLGFLIVGIAPRRLQLSSVVLECGEVLFAVICGCG